MAGKTDHHISRFLKQPISGFVRDAGCPDYEGCSFVLYDRFIKFRKSKTTPRKEGVFTSLWKRNTIGKTVPFDESDPFDFYIIMAALNTKTGYFVFPSRVLVEQGILSGNRTNGKRGFRLYPPWSFPQNKQALKTQEWQLEYFLEEPESGIPEELIRKQ